MKRPGRMFHEVMRSMFRKAATVRYPFVKVQMPARFRGRLKFDASKCIGCKLCMKDCPSGAITLATVWAAMNEGEARPLLKLHAGGDGIETRRAQAVLAETFAAAEGDFRRALERITLADLACRMKEAA